MKTQDRVLEVSIYTNIGVAQKIFLTMFQIWKAENER